MRIKEKRIHEYPFIVRIIMWAQKKKYGETLLPAKIWGRSPKLLYGLQAFYRAIDRKGSPLEPALRALINVKISQINHCEFCTDIGKALLEKRGVTIEKITAINDYENASDFTDRERSALAYAEAMTRSDIRVENKIFERLTFHFSENEIVELTALIGYQNLASKFNAALDIPAQGFCIPSNSNTKK